MSHDTENLNEITKRLAGAQSQIAADVAAGQSIVVGMSGRLPNLSPTDRWETAKAMLAWIQAAEPWAKPASKATLVDLAQKLGPIAGAVVTVGDK